MEIFDIYSENGQFILSGPEHSVSHYLNIPREAFARVRAEFDGSSPVVLYGNGKRPSYYVKPNVRN